MNSEEKIVYLLPVCLNGNRRSCGVKYLSSFLNENRDMEIIVTGDMNDKMLDQGADRMIRGTSYTNGYLETLGVAGEKIRRQSEDAGAVQFLDFCDENNLIILNGRTPGVSLGDYTYVGVITYVGARGHSLVDFRRESSRILNEVIELKIESQIFSDH